MTHSFVSANGRNVRTNQLHEMSKFTKLIDCSDSNNREPITVAAVPSEIIIKF